MHRKLHRAKCRRETTVLRRPMRFGIYIALAIAAVVGACASNPDIIDPIYVSPSTFDHLTCRQIGEEQKRITREEAANMQDGKATDAEQVGLLKGAMEARSSKYRSKRDAISNFSTDERGQAPRRRSSRVPGTEPEKVLYIVTGIDQP